VKTNTSQNIRQYFDAQILNAQENLLQQHLKYVAEFSPYYRNLYRKSVVNISSVKTIADLQSLPVTQKEDLQNFNMDFLCVDPHQVIEFCSTSGTLGSPVTIALTESDLERLALNEYNSFLHIDSNSDDIFHLMLSLDRQFMAGIAYYLGARKLGAGIIRGGPGNFSMHIQTIQRINPTVLVAVPSFIVGLIGYAFEHQIDLNKTSVKKIICIGENLRNEDFSLNALGTRIAANWNVQLFSTYASTEQQTAFTECKHGKGGHLQHDLLVFEILDEDNRQLPPGSPGELTITPLGVEGMPLIRYRTGDICSWHHEICECGRKTPRISPVLGRKKQLIKYKGTTLYPQTIFNALNDMDFVSDYVVRVFKNDMGTDDLEMIVSIKTDREISESALKQNLQSKLRIVPNIRLADTAQVQKMQLVEGKRKVTRLIDER
jgi:phenylacetate-CoA ligase